MISARTRSPSWVSTTPTPNPISPPCLPTPSPAWPVRSTAASTASTPCWRRPSPRASSASPTARCRWTRATPTASPRALVDGLGAPRLLVLGALSGNADPITAGSVSADEVDTVTDAFLGCLDIRQVFHDQFVAQGIPDDTAACLAREIPEQNLHDLFAAQFAGEKVDPNGLLGPALGACGLE